MTIFGAKYHWQKGLKFYFEYQISDTIFADGSEDDDIFALGVQFNL